jgi:Ca2+-binding RTX toxin-like protein
VSGPVALGGAAVTSVAIENDGNLPATGVVLRVSSTRAAHLSLSPCGGPVCGVGTIDAGATRTVDIAAGGVRSAVQFDVTAAASADQIDATPENASITTGVQVLNCTIVGTDGADDLTGTRKADRICGRPGPDRIDGGNGNDYIDAGNGNDTIVGGPGRDTIIARGGRDVIYARDGQLDWIDCGTEYDIAIVDRIDHVHGCEKVVRR